MAEVLPEPVEVKNPLTAADRCDRCGAQAYVKVTGVSGSLLFCAHDYVKNESALAEFAYDIQDERDKLS